MLNSVLYFFSKDFDASFYNKLISPPFAELRFLLIQLIGFLLGTDCYRGMGHDWFSPLAHVDTKGIGLEMMLLLFLALLL